MNFAKLQVTKLQSYKLLTAPVQASVDPSLMLMHVQSKKSHSETPAHQQYQLTTMHVVEQADRGGGCGLCLATVDWKMKCCGCSLRSFQVNHTIQQCAL